MASGQTLGTAYVQIMPSAKGIGNALSEAIGPSADSAGKSAGESIAGKIKSVIAAAGVGAALKSSLEAGGDLQQSFGGLETIYGEAADAAKAYAVQAAAAGISANDYAENAVSFGASLKQAFGGDTTKAVESANTALLDMADNSAKMGTDIGSLQTAYQGFAKQNYTMLDNLKLGYGGTKSEMERLLSDAQKLTGVEYNIDNLGDVYAAIHAIQADLGVTGVAAEEAKTTFSGSMNAMKAAATNLLASVSLGDDLGPALATLQDSVITFASNLLPMVGNVLSALPDVISGAFGLAIQGLNLASNYAGDVVTQGLELVQGLASAIVTGLPYLAEAAVNLVASFGSALLSVDWGATVTGFIGSLSDSISTAASEIFGTDDPGQIMTKIGEGITNAVPRLLEIGGEIIQGLATGITTIGAELPGIMLGLFETAGSFISSIDWFSIGNQVLQFVIDGIVTLGTALWEALTTLGTTAGELFKGIDWAGIGSEVLTYVVNGISSIGTTLWNTFTTLGTAAGELFKSIDWQSVGSTALTTVVNGISSIGSTLWSALTAIGTTAGELFKSIDWATVGRTALDFVTNGISSVGSALWSMLTGIGKTAGEMFKGVDWAGFGKAALNFIINGITGIASNVSSALRTAATNAGEAFKGINWAEVGRNVISGIAGGISGAAGAIADAARTAASNALDAAKRFLGIKSPSRVFRDQVGKNISLGLAGGILAEVGAVTGAIDDIAGASVRAWDGEFNLALSTPGGALASGSAGGTIEIINNIYGTAGMDIEQLAQRVSDRITFSMQQQRAVWGAS